MGPGPSRRARAEWLVGGGAAVLLIGMLALPWYGVSSTAPGLPGSGGGLGLSATGWEAFTSQRWVWALTIVVSLGAAGLAASGRRNELPESTCVIVTALGAASSVFILYRIIHHPAGGIGGAGFTTVSALKAGIWVGLASALAVAAGGVLWMREEGLSPTPAGPAGHRPSRSPAAPPVRAMHPQAGGPPPQPGAMPPQPGAMPPQPGAMPPARGSEGGRGEPGPPEG
ncbi:MAG: hypothetical protein KGJ43_00660 [Acidobacteriota bacterium]|nr:hypothetical protein [Acidobacteriota bacterium]